MNIDNDGKIDFQAALAVIDELHPSAAVLAVAQQKIRDPNSNIADLEVILKTDPSISADIVRMSNSVKYGATIVSKDIATSIKRLGFKELLKIVGLAVAKRLFSHDLLHYDMNALDYWAESVSTALTMEMLGMIMGKDDQEYYTIGLLSNIGKLVIDETLKLHEGEAIYDYAMPVCKWEESVVGFNNAKAGAGILNRWSFPRDISNAIEYQYSSENSGDQTNVLRALKFSRRIVEQTGYDYMHEDIEIDENMEGFLTDFIEDEDDLVQGLAKAADSFRIIKEELHIT